MSAQRTAHSARDTGQTPGVRATWDAPADLSKDPATIPDRSAVEVPPELDREIRDHMAKYPDRRSAALPALEAAQRVHGWCSPEAIDRKSVV